VEHLKSQVGGLEELCHKHVTHGQQMLQIKNPQAFMAWYMGIR